MPLIPPWVANVLLHIVDSLHLNFFRLHLIYFIITPLIFSAIFWGANGQYPVSYMDSLFLCVSAHTVTGLTPLNLSTITGFQQAILFFLMMTGNYTIVSLIMVLVRKNYIVQEVLRERPKHHSAMLRERLRSTTLAVFGTKMEGEPSSAEMNRSPPATSSTQAVAVAPNQAPTEGGTPQIVATANTPTPESTTPSSSTKEIPRQELPSPAPPTPRSPRSPYHDILGEALQRTESPSVIDPVIPTTPGQVNFAIPLTTTRTSARSRRPQAPPRSNTLTRTGTILITPVPAPVRHGTGVFFSRTVTRDNQQQNAPVLPAGGALEAAASAPLSQSPTRQSFTPPTYERSFGGFPGPLTLASRLAQRVAPDQIAALRRKLTLDDSGGVYTELRTGDQTRGADGADGATTAITKTKTEQSLQRRNPPHRVSTVAEEPASTTTARPALAPPYLEPSPVDAVNAVPEHLRHHVTIAGHKQQHHHHHAHLPHRHGTQSESSHTGSSSTGWISEMQEQVKRSVLYLRKQRNSAFNTDELTDEELEELGGIEYRALRILAWIVSGYYFGSQLIMFIVFAAYLYSTSKYDEVFTAQSRLVPKAWFSAFQATSTYTGGGLTLVDQGMIPFIDAYPLVIVQGWLMAAGTLILPCFLRMIVWILWKFASPEQKPPLEFLLLHPRRCYLYLFPSHQTWFLLVVFIFLTLLQWFGFLVLDIGISALEVIPLGQRVLASLFQSIAVRASGFPILPLASTAPAMKFLYLVMMYIAAYPIAMSIRATNVYEERSLGLYEDVTPLPEDSDPDVDEKAAKLVRGNRGEILFSKYLGMHVRRQLSYDLWWLALAVFLICIAERPKIMDPTTDSWFNQFTVMFELTSAYATVGLSLGVPYDNYSFSGALGTISKLVICIVMLRGRHRDLPQAIDRAIMLPEELARAKIDESGRHIIEKEQLNGSMPGEEGEASDEKRQNGADDRVATAPA